MAFVSQQSCLLAAAAAVGDMLALIKLHPTLQMENMFISSGEWIWRLPVPGLFSKLQGSFDSSHMVWQQ